MNRVWENHINRQLYSECQLVTVINVYYYLTGNIINQDSQEYEDLVDLCGARHGSAINIDKVYLKFGIESNGYSNHILDVQMDKWHALEMLKKPIHGICLELPEKKETIRLPIEVNVWHKKTGFHSVLIVDHCEKTGCFRITNFSCATSLKGWMFVEDLYQFLNNCNKGWVFRTFKLIQGS